MDKLTEMRQQLIKLANPLIAKHSKNYLKSDYAFYGIRVPQLRKIAKSYKNIEIYDALNLFDELWNSGNHEEMNLAIFIVQNHLKKLNQKAWNFLMNPQRIEKAKNWDHIDYLGTSLIGTIILNNPQFNAEIKTLAQSRNPWMRRLSIVSQYPSIKKNKIQLALLLAEKLCYDEDIYVQKATGWMLREAGKKNPVQVQGFIKIHRKMKPVCLSYATEKMLLIRKLIKNMKEEDKLNKNESEAPKLPSPSELNKIKYFKN